MAEVKLTPKLEALLDSCAPIVVDNEFLYTPKAYRDVYPEDKTQWHVFILSSAGGVDKVRAHDAGNIVGGNARFGAYSLALCDGHIHGWHNYRNLRTSKEVAYDPTFQVLPPAMLHELANVIGNPDENKLTPEEVSGLE